MARIEQKDYIDSWLLPCSLRSHHIANPRRKMGFAIFRLCPPTTLQEGGVNDWITKKQKLSI